MAARMNEMGERYNTLRAQGIPGEEAARNVNKEFGTDISYVTIRSYGSFVKKKSGALASRSQRKDHKKDRTPQRSKEASELPVKATSGLTPSAGLDGRIKAVAREVFEEMLHNMRNERNIITDTQDAPPEPHVITGGGKGRRENRKYIKASVTVDEALWQRFTEERDRMRVSTGRLMDIILWRHFGKPKLSFEK